MLRLAAALLRSSRSAAVAVACAVFGGIALVTAAGVLGESGLRSHPPVGRLAPFDVVVAAPQTYTPAGDLPSALPERARIPAALVAELGALPDVAGAAGDVTFPAAVLTAGGTVLTADGHGWSAAFAAPAGAAFAGAAPAGPADVALGEPLAAAAGVRPGDDVTVVVSGRSGTYRVTAVTPGAGTVRLADAFLPDPARVDLVALRVAPGATDRVAAAARKAVASRGLVVSTGAARGDVASPASAAARAALPALAGSIAGVVLLVVGFVAAGALAVAVDAQRRELALLRAVGATPRQVRRIAAGQAAVITGVVALPGVAAGHLLAGRFADLLAGAGQLPAGLPLTHSPLPGLAAAGLLTVIVLFAAWTAVRRPATAAVAEARAEPRTPPRWRGPAGALVVAAGFVLGAGPLFVRSPLGAAGTVLAGLVAAGGLALAGPLLVGRAAGAVARRLPPVSAPAWLAVANTHGQPMRVAGSVTTLAVTVVFAVTYTLTQTTVLAAAGQDRRDGTRAQLTMTAPALGGVPAGLVDAVRATPGVAAAAPVTATTVLWPWQFDGQEEVEAEPALVLDPAAAGVVDLDVRAGSLSGLTGATVALDASVARLRGTGVGRDVRLILGDGTAVTARVVAVYQRGLGFGTVVLAADLAAGHLTAAMPQRLLVRTDGTDPARQRLTVLAASHPGVALGAGAAAPGAGLPPELVVNVAVLSVVVAYTLLAVVNTLIVSTRRRREEFAALRLAGATPAQLRGMLRREAVLVAGFALAGGVLLAAVPLVGLSAGLLGRPWPAGPWWLLPAVAVAVVVVTMAPAVTRRPIR